MQTTWLIVFQMSWKMLTISVRKEIIAHTVLTYVHYTSCYSLHLAFLLFLTVINITKKRKNEQANQPQNKLLPPFFLQHTLSEITQQDHLPSCQAWRTNCKCESLLHFISYSALIKEHPSYKTLWEQALVHNADFFKACCKNEIIWFLRIRTDFLL